MSQPMEKQVGKQYAVPTQWTFSVDITTGVAFDPNAYRIIAGAATLQLEQNASGYTGSIQFNSPTMPASAPPGQQNWSKTPYPLFNPSYANGILSFTVPAAVPAFLNNFNGNSGAPIPPAPAGPSTGSFAFAGYWDGVSNVITGGCCWVPPGYLMDAGGVFGVGAPPNPTCPPQPGASAGEDGPGGEGGGGDPPMGTWGSGGA
jgi:hypothetical protein